MNDKPLVFKKFGKECPRPGTKIRAVLIFDKGHKISLIGTYYADKGSLTGENKGHIIEGITRIQYFVTNDDEWRLPDEYTQ